MEATKAFKIRTLASAAIDAATEDSPSPAASMSALSMASVGFAMAAGLSKQDCISTYEKVAEILYSGTSVTN